MQANPAVQSVNAINAVATAIYIECRPDSIPLHHGVQNNLFGAVLTASQPRGIYAHIGGSWPKQGLEKGTCPPNAPCSIGSTLLTAPRLLGIRDILAIQLTASPSGCPAAGFAPCSLLRLSPGASVLTLSTTARC